MEHLTSRELKKLIKSRSHNNSDVVITNYSRIKIVERKFRKSIFALNGTATSRWGCAESMVTFDYNGLRYVQVEVLGDAAGYSRTYFTELNAIIIDMWRNDEFEKGLFYADAWHTPNNDYPYSGCIYTEDGTRIGDYIAVDSQTVSENFKIEWMD